MRVGFGCRVLGVRMVAALLAGCSGSVGTTPIPGPSAPPPTRPCTTSSERARSGNHGYESLFSFNEFPDGRAPAAGLISANGLLYGTTSIGGKGTSGPCGLCGTVYSISTSGNQKVLYTFTGGSNGATPSSGLTSLKGVLYGTTFYGAKSGEVHKCYHAGCGTVFDVTASGAESVLHAFEGGSDGSAPMGELLALNGTLYGTTTGEPFGKGTIFSLTTSGHEQVVYRFKGALSDGAAPMGNLVLVKGEFYGVTNQGGAANVGTVFALNPSGKEQILHSFHHSEGDYPMDGLVALNGLLYGTTSAHGPHGRGTVYSITTGGEFHVVYSFGGKGDGALPYASLVVVNGALYGTTHGGGVHRHGTVFKLCPSGSESVLHSFGPSPDGIRPWAPLTNVNGVLYGTTAGGGQDQSYGDGTVFRISP
ncbi:MAG: choice-of-anchor tandem repeat GloVer-containing protein [Candidatus Cybelea sp.]